MMNPILKYCNEISGANTEEAKKLLFFNLLMELFKKNDEAKEIIGKMSLGAEKLVLNIPVNGKNKTGYADTQYGTVIIEFEKDLKKTQKHAEEQLKEYLAGNWSSGTTYNFTLISTDGIRWIIYGLKPESFIGKNNISASDLELKIVEWFVLDETKSAEFFIFIDRYLFRYEKQQPTLENIQIDFGESSPLFLNVHGQMKIFYETVKHEPDIKIAYDQWGKILSIAYGSFNASDEIFLVHTYLSVFAKLLAYSVITRDQFIDDDELKEIVEGTIFNKLQVNNFVENDFYKWVASPNYFRILKPHFRQIAAKISEYDFTNVKSDILKGVYQELIDLETRHALGEYYTPDWLCQQVVEHFDFERTANILDPSCGSGSFLLAAINRMKELHNDITVEELSSQITGIDIHPLSVQVAKTTLLVAFGNLLKNAKKPIHLNVFLSNSIITPEDKVTLFNDEFRVKIDNENYFLPAGTFDDAGFFDKAVSVADTLAHDSCNSKEIDPVVLTNALKKIKTDVAENLCEKFFEIYKGLKKAKEEGRDSIWKFILQNSYKPYFLKNRFDYVIGNPPWITYSDIKNAEYQQQLRELAEKYNLIPAKKANMPHLEIAAIFLSHSATYFLKNKGKLAFVLPRSFLSAEHHDNTRSGKARGFAIAEIWDFEKVSILFNVPSCVMFANSSHAARPFPESGIPGRIYSGRITKHNSTWDEIKNKVFHVKAKWYYSKLNKSSALTNERISSKSVRENFYKKHFRQGATIVPRNFYFVQPEGETPSDWDDRILSVRSDETNGKEAKLPWKNLKLKGLVSADFLFRTAIAKNIIPFGLINPYLVLLPIEIDTNKNIKILPHEEILRSGELETARWFREAEKLWNKYKTERSETMSLTDRLNFQAGITEQDLNKKYLVLYTASAKDANAVVIRRNAFDLEFIVESKAYVFYTNNLEEANYLCCFLNSNYANEKIKQFQSKGLFGPRDIHKKILDVYLPQYNEDNKIHRQIAENGKECSAAIQKFIKKNKLEKKEYNVGLVRREVRQLLANELKEIDKLLMKIS